MLFSFRNIGIIHSADIKVNGLTVITGHNSCGKSFIGKSIFSIVKAINGAVNELEDIKYEEIFDLIDKLHNAIQQELANDSDFYLRRTFFPPYIRRNVDRIEYRYRSQNTLFELADDTIIAYFKKLFIELTSYLNKHEVKKEFLQEVNNIYEEIFSILKQPIDEETILKNTYDKLIKSVFKSEFHTPRHCDSK